MLLSHLVDVDHVTGSLKYVDSRVDTFLCHFTVQYDLTIQVTGDNLYCLVSQIVCRDIDGLEGGDGTILSSTLLTSVSMVAG